LAVSFLLLVFVKLGSDKVRSFEITIETKVGETYFANLLPGSKTDEFCFEGLLASSKNPRLC
jgi:hypothetical protein